MIPSFESETVGKHGCATSLMSDTGHNDDNGWNLVIKSKRPLCLFTCY